MQQGAPGHNVWISASRSDYNVKSHAGVAREAATHV